MNIGEILKGIIIGIAKIIPGLSGAVIMISFNLYDRAIDAVTNFLSDVKGNFLFLVNLFLGIVIGIVFFSKVISYFIVNYYVYTTSLFIGLILGGFKVLFSKLDRSRSNLIIILISFIVMFILSLISGDNNYVIRGDYTDYVVFFIGGVIEAFGTVLPGISSTALLMLLGIYNIYILCISNIFNFSMIIDTMRFLIPFSLGLLIGIIFIMLLVNYLFKYYYQKTFSFIIGVSLSSSFILIIRILFSVSNAFSLIICIIIMLIGYFIMSKI